MVLKLSAWDQIVSTDEVNVPMAIVEFCCTCHVKDVSMRVYRMLKRRTILIRPVHALTRLYQSSSVTYKIVVSLHPPLIENSPSNLIMGKSLRISFFPIRMDSLAPSKRGFDVLIRTNAK